MSNQEATLSACGFARGASLRADGLGWKGLSARKVGCARTPRAHLDLVSVGLAVALHDAVPALQLLELRLDGPRIGGRHQPPARAPSQRPRHNKQS